MNEDTLLQIRQSRLFLDVDLSVVVDELAETRLVKLAPGQILLDPLCANHDIFVILSGQLLVSADPGGSMALARLKSGDCVGEISIIDDEPPSAYVLASVETELLAISQGTLWKMLRKLHAMALNLLHVLAHRFRQNNSVLLDSLEMQRRYRNLSETDALTGLHNRAWCNEIFPKQLELSERIGQPIALAMLDIDHFKQVNDRYGHPVGDVVLQNIGQLFHQNLRTTDLSARFGGEEFIVLMPATPLSKAALSAERLRKKIDDNEIELTDGRTLKCTVSIGIAEWRPGLRLDELIGVADMALYRAKHLGRNRVCDRTHD
jgi:diguanylate cyclase (GGDEF)-like protein